MPPGLHGVEDGNLGIDATVVEKQTKNEKAENKMVIRFKTGTRVELTQWNGIVNGKPFAREPESNLGSTP